MTGGRLSMHRTLTPGSRFSLRDPSGLWINVVQQL
jgi:hypothetical protein